jgi:cell division transport system permease protein
MKALAVRAHALREMARLLRRRPGSFLLAVLVAAAVFTLPLVGASIARSVAPLAEQLPLGPEISLFLSAAAPATEIRQLQSRLAARPDVQRVEWVTRDAALKSLAQRSGNAGLGELKPNPLPDVLVVTLATQVTAERVDLVAAEMRSLPRVEAVAADAGWHRKLAALLRILTAAGTIVGGLGAGLLVLVVLASVQLQLSASAAEIRVLRMVGAEPRFIVRPYAYAGALTLLCGFALAALLAWAGLRTLQPLIAEAAGMYGFTVVLDPLPPLWLAAAAAGAALTGGVVAAIGLRSTVGATR